jgi:hypothetical protein
MPKPLIAGGCDGLIVENMWDIPFRAGAHIPPESIASHAVVAAAIRSVSPLPMGINLVHNGGVALLAIALAAQADFIRVCMFTGAGVWDAGSFDEGCAADLMRRRKELHAEHIKILADVDKKHSVRFPGIDFATHIEWTRFFGADALIVSGRMTGDAPDVAKVREAKQPGTLIARHYWQWRRRTRYRRLYLPSPTVSLSARVSSRVARLPTPSMSHGSHALCRRPRCVMSTPRQTIMPSDAFPPNVAGLAGALMPFFGVAASWRYITAGSAAAQRTTMFYQHEILEIATIDVTGPRDSIAVFANLSPPTIAHPTLAHRHPTRHH